MKICPKCGSQNSNNNLHCGNCGASLSNHESGSNVVKIMIPMAILAIGIVAGVVIGTKVLPMGSDNPNSNPTTETASANAETASGADTQASPEKDESHSPREDDPMALTDSWEEIIEAGKDGTYKEKYVIGDTKELDLGKEGVITMKLAAMDADELADGSGYAAMTWVATNLLNTEYAMNIEDTVDGGWPETSQRAWLNSDFLSLFPEDLSKEIKTVKKYSFSFFPETKTLVSYDRIWVPSCREMFGVDGGDEDNGPTYNDAFPNPTYWERCHINSGERTNWTMRSVIALKSGLKGFVEGSEGGYYKTEHTYLIIHANNKCGVVIGFCL